MGLRFIFPALKRLGLSLVALTLVSQVWLSLAVVSAAATFDDYRRRVTEATEISDRLLKAARLTPKAEIWIPSLHLKPEEATAVRNLLPQTETVEYHGQTMAVDNRRTYELLVRQERTTSWEDSIHSLEQLNNELHTLRERLLEKEVLRTGQASDERAKINDILAREDFTLKKEDSWRERMFRRLLEWLANLFEKIWPKVGVNSPGYTEGLKVVLWVVFAVVLIWFSRLVYLRFKNRTKTEKKAESKNILGENLDEIQSADELLSAGLDFARKGEYRQAIRKVYIALLYELDKQHLIQIEPGLTNREYLNAVKRQTRLYPPMDAMTNRFDEVWYGQIATNQDDYQNFLVKYREALGALPSTAK